MYARFRRCWWWLLLFGSWEAAESENATKVSYLDAQFSCARLGFACGEPRPYSVRLKDLVGNAGTVLEGDRWMVVLRCSPDRGCCRGRNKQCCPDKVETFELEYNVRSNLGITQIFTTATRKMQNHLVCKCKTVVDERRGCPTVAVS
ncbi:uncharacterized protein LOC132698603 [Cylas formicarius]|uniref:uncharacterized protein LOC132698603 n=1 Tax=Cylas formicarius TaxID=197179 RepID=UPI002958BBDF|nr:uncharacterized protein LOC132698603 [Cylas formicarius]